LWAPARAGPRTLRKRLHILTEKEREVEREGERERERER